MLIKRKSGAFAMSYRVTDGEIGPETHSPQKNLSGHCKCPTSQDAVFSGQSESNKEALCEELLLT